jgi:DNA-directed RNA polymerase subunit M
MKFCEKCGSVLFPTKKGNKCYLECRMCGRKIKSDIKRLKFETLHKMQKKVAIEEKLTLPVTIKYCPKCESSKAYFWTQQSGIEDEPPTQFFKCVNCGYVWRGE